MEDRLQLTGDFLGLNNEEEAICNCLLLCFVWYVFVFQENIVYFFEVNRNNKNESWIYTVVVLHARTKQLQYITFNEPNLRLNKYEK